MRILVLNTDYIDFQRSFYVIQPNMVDAPYTDQLAARHDTLFGKADFYPRNFTALGHLSEGIIANNIWMQTQWARERGMRVEAPPEIFTTPRHVGAVAALKRHLMPYKTLLHPIAKRLGLTAQLTHTMREILLAQVEHFNPDVILNQDMDAIDPATVRLMRRQGRTVIGQCGTDPPPGIDLSVYDFAITLIPWVVEYFRSRGLPASHQPLAFEPSILEKLGPAPEKDVDVSFVGSLNAMHSKRIAFLEALAERYEVSLWLPSSENIPAQSPLRSCYRGTAWGREMYNVIQRSKISLNFHADFARGTAGNMRLYEATGVGTCLMTDNLSDLPTLFAPGAEVLTYDNVADCVTGVGAALAEPALLERVAKAGQRKTLREHTYRHRTMAILELIANRPRLN
jgi:hypothetical protein